MDDKNTLDIGEVCTMLGVTSRTLRFYEEKGIIESTTPQFTARRRYTSDQIEHIKKVLVLRSLGLSVAKIKDLQCGSDSLSDAIAERKARLTASIMAKAKEIQLLDEALARIEAGDDIFTVKESQADDDEYGSERMEVVKMCTDAFISGDYEVIFSYFSDKMKEYATLSTFHYAVGDTLKPLGDFVGFDRYGRDTDFRSTYYSYLKYERLILRLKFVFIKDEMRGFWMQYVDYQKNNTEDAL